MFQWQAVVLNALRPRVALSADFVDLLKRWEAPKEGRVYLGSVGMRIGYAEAFGAGKLIHEAPGCGPEMLDILARIGKLVKTVRRVK